MDFVKRDIQRSLCNAKHQAGGMYFLIFDLDVIVGKPGQDKHILFRLVAKEVQPRKDKQNTEEQQGQRMVHRHGLLAMTRQRKYLL
jgi:hypothetical protein